MGNLKKSFGKRKVTTALKTSLVQEVFTNVAEKYDGMNEFMSLGAHRLWKKELIDLMNIQSADTIIDVGSGTGDLIDLILNKGITNSIYSIDLNNAMLQHGKKRFKHKDVYFVNANAESLPFKNNFFDKYIVSFCLRNVTDMKKALNEALRILKPGGTFYCLEFSSPKSSLINSI
jgi:demethylmenaquinone methyltransferase/2-methoxy-6-polyprenyl-1,4-benzoquinol methylase